MLAEGTPPPRDRLWIRGFAFGVDLIVLAGPPLLVGALIVFGVLLARPDAGAEISGVFRAGQATFLVLFLLRDARGLSPGKRLAGLRVIGPEGRPASFLQSAIRNATLLVPGWNLVEGLGVIRRADGRRLGDRLAGTRVSE